jgi:nucleoid-associated protein YgaU
VRRILCTLWLATLGLTIAGCVGEEAAPVPTRSPAVPTVVRPPLANPSPSPSPSPSPLPAGQTYTVRPGDTLSSIAAQVYNDPGEWRRIFEANRDQLSSPEGLRAGMTIRIPPLPRPG